MRLADSSPGSPKDKCRFGGFQKSGAFGNLVSGIISSLTCMLRAPIQNFAVAGDIAVDQIHR